MRRLSFAEILKNEMQDKSSALPPHSETNFEIQLDLSPHVFVDKMSARRAYPPPPPRKILYVWPTVSVAAFAELKKLGIEIDANLAPAEYKKIYRRSLKQFHPDLRRAQNAHDDFLKIHELLQIALDHPPTQKII